MAITYLGTEPRPIYVKSEEEAEIIQAYLDEQQKLIEHQRRLEEMAAHKKFVDDMYEMVVCLYSLPLNTKIWRDFGVL